MADQLNKQEVAMLREELEMLMHERTGLLKVVVANTDAPPAAGRRRCCQNA